MNNRYEKNVNYIIKILNNLNLEIATLHNRISHLEKINNASNDNKYFYKINDFQIPYIDHILFNKNYYYIKPYSKIDIKFSCDFISHEKLYKDLNFRFNILDNNDNIIYSKDKHININDHSTFEMILNIDKDIINPIIQFIILGENPIFFNPGEMFIEGCYFKNCKLYINFSKELNKKFENKNIKLFQ